ncbi:MAG: hydroxyethylthiazole kinase [Methanosphaera sp.]|nr:hydroxyethylthiazole kinase [Methanosphaera sp.]
MNEIINNICDCVIKLRKESPLVHCITNTVTVNDCANAVLAIGASPIMANEPLEAEEMVTIVNSLLINIGTLNQKQIEAMKIAAETADKLGKSYVLDPVGIGVSNIRNQTSLDLIKSNPTIIRGNLSEIKTLANLIGILEECSQAKGVDVAEGDVLDNDTLESNAIIVKNIAEKLNTTIAVSGPIDIISDGKEVYAIENGHRMMSQITGSGCMLGCILAAYTAIATPLTAAITATAVLGISGEIAAQTTIINKKGTGTFRSEMINELSKIDDQTVQDYIKIRKL